MNDIVRIARDGSRATTLQNGQIHNDSLSSTGSESDEQREEVAVKARSPNLFFTTECIRCISEADIILITVNTPTKSRGRGAGSATDMGALEGATRDIALHARPGTILVEKSTVPCGTSELIKDLVRNFSYHVKYAHSHSFKLTDQECHSKFSQTRSSWLKAQL